MPIRKKTFTIQSRTGGGSGSPDWEKSYSLAVDDANGELYVLYEWSEHAPDEKQCPGSRRITLDEFMAKPSEERKSLFGLMGSLVP